jgi:hypothetical protein
LRSRKSDWKIRSRNSQLHESAQTWRRGGKRETAKGNLPSNLVVNSRADLSRANDRSTTREALVGSNADDDRDGSGRVPASERAGVLSIGKRGAGDLRVHASRASNEHMSCYLRAGHYSLPDLLYFTLRGRTRDSSGSGARTPVTSRERMPRAAATDVSLIGTRRPRGAPISDGISYPALASRGSQLRSPTKVPLVPR